MDKLLIGGGLIVIAIIIVSLYLLMTKMIDLEQYDIKPKNDKKLNIRYKNMIYDGILFRNGFYEVYISIQDGTEFCGKYDTEEQARSEYGSSQKALNGNLNKVPAMYKEKLVSYIEYVKI